MPLLWLGMRTGVHSFLLWSTLKPEGDGLEGDFEDVGDVFHGLLLLLLVLCALLLLRVLFVGHCVVWLWFVKLC
jgi:hypothetical protein